MSYDVNRNVTSDPSMGIHRIEPGTENATECSVPSLFALSQMALSKPVRGPIFTGVLSTKYTDQETGLVMYQLRAYSPGLGRFISRDLVEESGGVALYRFAFNSPENACDYLEPVP